MSLGATSCARAAPVAERGQHGAEHQELPCDHGPISFNSLCLVASSANDASIAVRAMPRRAASPRPALSYSAPSVVWKNGGSSELSVTRTPASINRCSGWDVAVRIQAERDVAAGADLQDDAAPRQLGHQGGIVGRAHAVADAGHRQVADRGPHAFRPQHLAGMDGAAVALVVGQPVGRREVGGRELGLVAAHAEAHDIVMRLGHHGSRHGERPLGPEMADADDDDAALDAEVAPGAVDAAFERLEPGVVGDAQRRRPLGRAEHLDIDRALGARRSPDRNRSHRRNRAPCAASCRRGRRRRGSSENPSRHSGRARRSGRRERPGRCGPPARAPAPAGSSLRDGNAVRPWESRKSSQRQVRPLQPVVGRILGTPVDQVQGIGVARPRRAVGRAGMRQQPVQHDQACRAAPRAPPARCPATACRRASR